MNINDVYNKYAKTSDDYEYFFQSLPLYFTNEQIDEFYTKFDFTEFNDSKNKDSFTNEYNKLRNNKYVSDNQVLFNRVQNIQLGENNEMHA